MEETLLILFLIYLAIMWVILAILMRSWKKEDEEKYNNERQNKRN